MQTRKVELATGSNMLLFRFSRRDRRKPALHFRSAVPLLDGKPIPAASDMDKRSCLAVVVPGRALYGKWLSGKFLAAYQYESPTRAPWRSMRVVDLVPPPLGLPQRSEGLATRNATSPHLRRFSSFPPPGPRAGRPKRGKNGE